MANTTMKELNIPINDKQALVGHYNLDQENDCFVISYHVNNIKANEELYIPTRYFLRKVGNQWLSGNYENGNQFETFTDPFIERINKHLLKQYYPAK